MNEMKLPRHLLCCGFYWHLLLFKIRKNGHIIEQETKIRASRSRGIATMNGWKANGIHFITSAVGAHGRKLASVECCVEMGRVYGEGE